MGDSLPWTPMNRRAKFDAASFILGGEIRNHTKTNTNTQTVNDISTTYAYRHVWIEITLALPADKNDDGSGDDADEGDSADDVQPRWTRVKLCLDLPHVTRNKLAVPQLSPQVGPLEALATDARAFVAERVFDVAGRHAGTSMNVGYRLLVLTTRTCNQHDIDNK